MLAVSVYLISVSVQEDAANKFGRLGIYYCELPILLNWIIAFEMRLSNLIKVVYCVVVIPCAKMAFLF